MQPAVGLPRPTGMNRHPDPRRPRPHRSLRSTGVLTSAFALIATLGACTTSGVSAPQASTTRSCPPQVIGDPWIAFEQSLKSQDTLTVGARGYLRTDASVEDVEVSGDEDAVRLENGRITNTTDCGTKRITSRWLEVHGVQPGVVRISVPGRGASDRSVTTVTVEK